MPQMSPYNWLIMFMIFNMIFFIIISINFFINFPKMNYMKKNYKINKFLLKW